MKIVDKIEQWDIDKLIPYIKNSRTHSDEQIAQIAASIKAFGFTNPLLVGSDGVIVAGHGRLSAARKLGLSQVPVIVLDHLSDTERRALVIADNKLALNAGWDTELLTLELRELAELNVDLSLTGFDLQELGSLFDDEKSGEKELEQQEYSEVFNVIVECKDENEQQKIFNRLDAEGYKCRVQSL